MKSNRQKLISLLIEKKLVPSTTLAKALILEGRIKIDGKVIDKPGTSVNSNSLVEIILKIPYVSRGGIKIEKVFNELDLRISGKKAIDVGASTGGFTDFLIKNGAEKVITIDVGYGQLSWNLRKSSKVIILERTNVRYLDKKKLPFLSDFTVVDVSFISVKTIFKKILDITCDNGEILILIKPQFEIARDEVEKKGIIKDKKLHSKVLLDIIGFIRKQPVEIKKLTYSKLKGTKGNIEYWVYLKKSIKKKKTIKNYDKIVEEVVDESHIFFKSINNI